MRDALHDTNGLMGGGIASRNSKAVLCLMWCNNTIPRPNTSHAQSPTHHDHMHAPLTALTLYSSHTTLVYT
jgi:hypothetical protein